MVLTIIALTGKEEFLQFLDPDLCTIEETIEKQGLRTISFNYKFQTLNEDKSLFKLGNKIWIQGDTNLSDCLYVINTEVEQDIFKENEITFEAEEVLVELNYAPLFSQTEITASNGFTVSTTNGKQEITVNWNALNYWFGAYFNIGVVQQCLSPSYNKISLNGTINLMSLLRYIEDETGNVFVTRYEKDLHNNIIHRYLDFLNPINVNKNWEYNLEYDFISTTATGEGVFDENNNPINDRLLDVEDEDDLVEFQADETLTNINPSNIKFRIVDENYEVITVSGNNLEWLASDIGFEDDGTTNSLVVQLRKNKSYIAIETKEKSFMVQENNTCDAITNGYITTENDDSEKVNTNIPDGSSIEVYDYVNHTVLFRTLLNTQIGRVHSEVLDFGFNLDNVVFNVDETDTVKAVSPVLSLDESESGGNNLTRNDLSTIINNWRNLSIEKGQVIPMIVEKVNQSGTASTGHTAYENAVSALGTCNLSTNYWSRPLKPNDNIDSDTKQYEFYKATAYWKAPYDKVAGELYVRSDKVDSTEYTSINGRPDNRDKRKSYTFPKNGTTETSDEDKYAIYNQVCMYLQEHETPNVQITVDVANLRGFEYNSYDLYDKIYIKLPDSQDLLTARIVKTTKEAHDVSKNTLEIENYNVNIIKHISDETYIEAPNVAFKYPKSTVLTGRLVNADYDEDDPYSLQYPANKLITATLYTIENQSSTWNGTVYTKLTDTNGYFKIPMKYDPGNYELKITFSGDEEYTETSLTIKINVSGTKEVATKTTTKTTKAKTTAKTSTTTKTIKTYWSKCGVSPDKKELVSIAKPSGPDATKYAYTWYKTVFKNYCPICKTWGNLRFDGGKANKCITSAGARGRGYKIGVPEHEITCNKCDSDYCGVTGAEKWYNIRGRLTTVKKPVRSTTSEFALLTKGKLQYGTQKVSTKQKKVTSTKTRTTTATIPSAVKNQALKIVGDSKGWAAAKKIAQWCGTNIHYSYETGFSKTPQQVLSSRKGNCCSQTRLMLQMMDAAGCTEYLTLKYVHVCCHPSKNVGHVFAKLIHKTTGSWCYVDPCKEKNPWGHYVHGWGSPPGNQSTYPTKPF